MVDHLGPLDKKASIRLTLSLLFVTLIVAFITAFFVVREHYFPKKFRKTIFRESEKNDLNPILVASLIYRESRFREKIISKHGDMGLMQILPITLKELKRLKLIKENEINSDDLLDGKINIRMGTLYLAHLKKRIEDISLRKEKIEDWYDGSAEFPLLIAYNAGPTVALQGYLDHSTNKAEYLKTVKSNRPTSYKYANDILNIKSRLEWFELFLLFE